MKTIILTGATVPGYGQAITQKLLKEGYSIIGTYPSEDESEALDFQKSLNNSKLSLYPLDLWSRNSLDEFLQHTKDMPIVGLVLSQYYWNMENPNHFDFDSWDKSIAANLTAPNYLIRKLTSNLSDGKGNVVVITSTEGLTGNYGSTAYAAARAGEHNLVKSLANLLGPIGIRVNALAPGWIDSIMDTDIFNRTCEITPLGRLGLGNEIADVVFWLLSSTSSFVNGATIVCDGGYSNADTMAKFEFEESQK